MGSRSSFTRVDAATFRVTPHRPSVAGSRWPAGDDGPQAWRQWLRTAWEQPAVAAALAVASLDFADRIDTVLVGDGGGTVEELRRLAISLARYLVRMRSRATPFGLFAAVAPARFGTLDVHLGSDHHVWARPDVAWIAAVIAEMEGCAPVRRRLAVARNDLATVRGDRLVIPWQPHARHSRQAVAGEIDLRHVPIVQAIIAASETPIPVNDLISKVTAEFPGADDAAVEAVTGRLIAVGALITCLRPDGTTTDLVGHLIEQLALAGVDDIPEAAQVLAELRHTQNALADSGRRPWHDRTARARLSAEMSRPTVGSRHAVSVDLRRDGVVVVPESVAVEAAAAADALHRLGPRRNPAWHAYHLTFLARYGSGAVVPVRELLDPTGGLGFPHHFTAAEPLPSAPADGEGELLRLAQQAALDGLAEVELDDPAIDMIAAEAADPRPVSHADICVDIRSPSTATLAAGRFLLGVNGIGRSAAATAGRFLAMFGEADRARMLAAYTRMPPDVAGAVLAQLSFPPNTVSLENVVHTPAVVENVISLGEHRRAAAHLLRLDDLAVTADQDRFYLLSMSRRRVVEPMMANAASRHTMPLIARFLAELPRATSAPLAMFSWGVGEYLPYRPRVRYRRTVLSPAQWNIDTTLLAAASAGERDDRLLALRDRLHIPSMVEVGSGDQRLRLNLEEAMDRTVLHDFAAGKTRILLREAPTPADYGWIGGHPHELVIPLASTAARIPAPHVLAGAAPLPVVTSRAVVIPGGRVLSAKLYGHPDVFDLILTGHLRDLLTRWQQQVPVWWFIRFRDPAPHLRLRLHVDDYGQAATRLGEWAAGLRDIGLVVDLVLDSYHPETARYGAGPALAAAERLFAADSAAAVAQLNVLASNRSWHMESVTAASLVDLASGVLGGKATAMRWLLAHPDLADIGDTGRSRLDPQLVREVNTLAGTGGPSPLADTPLAEAWRHRSLAAADYAAVLTTSDSHLDPSRVLVSLMHMHHIRTQGIDSRREATTYRLARAVALRWNATHPAADSR